MKHIESLTDVCGGTLFARMSNRQQACVSRPRKRLLEFRRRVADLCRIEPDSNEALPVGESLIEGCHGVFGRQMAMARGAAKATVFALANPDCARKLHWAHYPSTKPTGADEATLIRWDMNNQQAQLDSLSDGYKLNGGRLWGNIDAAAFDRLVAFMLAARQIERTIPAKDLVIAIPDFFAKVNAFDVRAIEDSARACRF